MPRLVRERIRTRGSSYGNGSAHKDLRSEASEQEKRSVGGEKCPYLNGPNNRTVARRVPIPPERFAFPMTWRILRSCFEISI